MKKQLKMKSDNFYNNSNKRKTSKTQLITFAVDFLKLTVHAT